VTGPTPGATYGWGQRNTRQLSQHLAIAGRRGRALAERIDEDQAARRLVEKPSGVSLMIMSAR
jgi:hypothetical protein